MQWATLFIFPAYLWITLLPIRWTVTFIGWLCHNQLVIIAPEMLATMVSSKMASRSSPWEINRFEARQTCQLSLRSRSALNVENIHLICYYVVKTGDHKKSQKVLSKSNQMMTRPLNTLLLLSECLQWILQTHVRCLLWWPYLDKIILKSLGSAAV